MCCDAVVCTGHQEKPNILTFHPQARDVLMSAGYDGKIFIWDLSNHRVVMEMDPLSQPVCSKQLYMSVCYFSCTVCYLSYLLLHGVQMERALLRWLRITDCESTIPVALPVPLERGRGL